MKTIHLQGIGRKPAIECGNLKPGDRILYNYGATGEVLAVEPFGRGSVKITTREQSGNVHTRTRRAGTLCGIVI